MVGFGWLSRMVREWKESGRHLENLKAEQAEVIGGINSRVNNGECDPQAMAEALNAVSVNLRGTKVRGIRA